MQQMILPSTPITPENHHNFMEKGSFDAFKERNGINSDIIPGHRIYMSKGMCEGPAISHTDLKMLGPEESKKIKSMIDIYGEDVTMAMADIFHSFKKNANDIASTTQGFVEKTGDVLTNKISKINALVEEQQKMRKDIVDFRTIARNQTDIKNQVDSLKLTFQSEVKKNIAKRKQIKDINLTGADAVFPATSYSKSSTKIDILDRIDFKKLVNLTKYVKLAGKGLILLDIGIRLYKVYQDTSAGKDWHKSLVSQAAGFTAATAVTALGFSLVTATVSIGVILSGPFLVVGLATAVGLSYATVKLAGTTSKNVEGLTGSGYDYLSKILEDDKGSSFDAISY